eukprot:scaffold2971_cov274-Pinguiococcus_pyrenoidosus.AAC.13
MLNTTVSTLSPRQLVEYSSETHLTQIQLLRSLQHRKHATLTRDAQNPLLKDTQQTRATPPPLFLRISLPSTYWYDLGGEHGTVASVSKAREETRGEFAGDVCGTSMIRFCAQTFSTI